MRYSPNVRIADPAALGVFYRKLYRSPGIALSAVQLNLQCAGSALRWPECLLNNKGLRVAVMADEQLLLQYHSL